METGNPTRRDNGAQSVPVNHLIITITVDPWNVGIAGHVENDALALAALRQAVDCYEAKIRQAYAINFMQQQREAVQNAQLAASVRGGRV